MHDGNRHAQFSVVVGREYKHEAQASEYVSAKIGHGNHCVVLSISFVISHLFIRHFRSAAWFSPEGRARRVIFPSHLQRR